MKRGTSEKIKIWAFNLQRRRKKIITLAFDVTAVPLCLFLSLLMRHEKTNFIFHIDSYISAALVSVIVIAFFEIRGLYNTYTRHISLGAYFTILIGGFLSSAFLLLAILYFGLQIPKSVPFIFYLVLVVVSTSVRFFITVMGASSSEGKIEAIAIFGIGAQSIQIMDVLKRTTNYQVKIFIDEAPEHGIDSLAGIPVIKIDSAGKQLKALHIKTIFIDDLQTTYSTRLKLYDLINDEPLRIVTVPRVSEIIQENLNNSHLKDIRIEDLLGRAPVQPEPLSVAKNIENLTILITGAGGSIGSELCRQVTKLNPSKLIILDISEFSIYQILRELEAATLGTAVKIIPIIGSVQDKKLVRRIFKKFSIDSIYHAAAYKHVPLMEMNVIQCIENNVFGTLNIAEAALYSKVKNFTLISSDKAVNSSNVMGATKRIAELICQAIPKANSETCFSIVRFGNVLGSSGSVVPLFKEQIKCGGPVTITHKEITRYFMTINEAVQLVIHAGSISSKTGVFVLDMGQPIKILDLAQKMIALSGFKPVLGKEANSNSQEIEIKISGLRAGEKLYEELSYNDELTATSHPRIMLAREQIPAYPELKKILHSLTTAIKSEDYRSIGEVLTVVAGKTPKTWLSKDPFSKHP